MLLLSKGARRALLTFIVLCLTIQNQTAVGQSEEWKPTDEQLKQLAREFRGDAWSIRPPKDGKHRLFNELTEKRYTWQLGDAGLPKGSLSVVVAKGAANLEGLDEDAAAALELAKKKAKNLVANEVEVGTVNGKRFARIRYKADSIEGLSLGEKFGFVYVTDDHTNPFVVMGVGEWEVIQRLEAAAQTAKVGQ